jgi:hypothetical protein
MSSDCDGRTAGTEGEASSVFQETGASVLVETFETKMFRHPEMQPLYVLFNILPGWWIFVGMEEIYIHVVSMFTNSTQFVTFLLSYFTRRHKRSRYASRVTSWGCMGRWMIRLYSFYDDISTYNVCRMYSWDVVGTWMIDYMHMVFHLKYWGEQDICSNDLM